MKKDRQIRWKTLVVVVALLIVALLCIQTVPSLADSMLRTPLSVLGVLLLLLWIPGWTLLFSGCRWKTRGLVVGATLGVSLALSLLVRVDGFEGDILPQLSWAWEPRPGEVYDELELDATTWREELPGALDSPAFLGPGGTNLATTEALPERWFEMEPQEVWRRKIGLGWSSFAVARGLAITQEQRGDEEVVVAYALENGAAVWTHSDDVAFREEMGGDGPRATPAIAGERVIARGATGMVSCLDLLTGELRWSRHVLEEHGHGNLEWGQSSSPLVVRGLVVVTLGNGSGGALVAYDLETGEERWRAGEYNASYSSPVLRELNGQDQIVVIYADHLAGHLVETGEMLWSVEIPQATANVANPVVLPPDRVMVAFGYGKGARMYQVTRGEDDAWGAEQLWRSMAMKPKFTNLVARGQHVYGLDEGRLACVDLADGRRVWKGGRWGHGQVLGVGEHLVIQAESGEIIIVESSPEEERELGRFDALEGKTWNQPVLAGRYLLVRNDREAVCFAYPAP